MAVFSHDDKAQISEAIAQAESATAGELVVATVSQSAPYDFERASAAALWSVATAFLVTSVFPALTSGTVLVMQVVLGIILWFVFDVDAILRPLIAKAKAATFVQERAMRMFVERGVHNTRDRSGLLILLSELEQQVVILGDEGIHERVGTDGWQGHVEHIIAGIRSGRAGAAVVEVVEELGGVLAENFPRRADDTNELSDSVVEE